MKILKIEFENINSLAGKWCIDFTDPSYSELDHSLFVISGKTGVGKTSILDAITLALYGATPRQGVVSNGENGNAVMTSDKGSCFARVTYRCRKGTFVSEWNQHRADNKPDGNLQPAEGLIYNLDRPEDVRFKENAGTPRNKNEMNRFGKANADIMQLDYSQFCRSIMLAQGEFSKFLTSDERERADILEKLNGTERYRRIGAKVGAHKSAANAARDLAQKAFDTQAGNMPNDEDIAKDEALLAESAEKEKNLKEQAAEFEAKIAWRNSMDACTKSMQKAEEDLAEATKNKTAFAESEARLAKAERARECVSAYTELQGLRKRESADSAELKKLNDTLPGITDKLNKAKEAKTAAETAKTAAEKFVAENEALWNEIRKLDQDVKNAVNAKSDAETRKGKAAEALANAETNLERAKKEIESLEPQVNTLKQAQEANAKDAELAGIIAQGETLVASIRRFGEELAAEEKAKVAAGKDYATAEENLKAAQANKCELLEQQNELFRNDVLVLANVIQSHLEEGAPCPVCGSKEHPACGHAENATADESGVGSTAEKIRELNAKMQAAETRIGQYELAMGRARTAGNAAAERIDSLTRQKGEAVGAIAALLKPWAEFDIANADAILADLKKRQKLFEANKAQLDESSKKLDLTRNNAEMFGETVKKEKDTLATETTAYENAVRNLEALRTTRTEKFGDKDVEAVAKEANGRKADAEDAYKTADKAFREAENDSNDLNTRIASLKKSLEKTAGEITVAATNFKNAIAAKGFADEAAFMTANMDEQEFARLSAMKKATDDALASAKGKRQAAADALEKVKSERSDETPLQTLVDSKKKLEDELGELQQKTGAARNRVDSYKKGKVRLQELQKELDAANAEAIRWKTMGDWFGVMDGRDFATFVQGLTFKSLLKLANKHLQMVMDRFRLVADGDLGFKVNDAEFDGQRRISNLSGGEKFLVSLSLALGIADFASRNVRVESLFMDEGFGTLDDATLEDVMNCLKGQQRQGKMLGIITHVESVVNSINQKIKVDRIPGQNGHSCITGPGVSRMQ
jgi:exonuclease SbcC